MSYLISKNKTAHINLFNVLCDKEDINGTNANLSYAKDDVHYVSAKEKVLCYAQFLSVRFNCII